MMVGFNNNGLFFCFYFVVEMKYGLLISNVFLIFKIGFLKGYEVIWLINDFLLDFLDVWIVNIDYWLMLL